MKLKALSIAVLAGFISMNSTAGFEQFDGPNGYMNVFSANGVDYLWGSPWGIADLQAITTDNRTFELLPNIGQYAFGASQAGTTNYNDVTYWTNSDDGGLTAGPDGNKVMAANTLFERTVATTDQTAYFEFTVDAFDLDPRYELVGFIKVLDAVGESFDVLASDTVTISGLGTFALTVSTVGQTNQLLQAGFEMIGLNAPSNGWGSATVTATTLYVDDEDDTAPTPDPMTFAVAPYPSSDSAITMTATTATDDWMPAVEYLFTNTTVNTTSGWQSSPTWTDLGPAGSVITQYLPIANADFTTDGASWNFYNNTWEGWGSPSDCGWMDDGGNGVVYADVDGTAGGGYAVIVQAIPLAATDFSAGDTVTFSGDIKALPGLNGGGALLKVESYSGGTKINELEVLIPGTTESWATYSMDYTIAAGADQISIVCGTSTGWAAPNATASSYVFDNFEVSKEASLPGGLTPSTTYTYLVKARDTSILQNETAWSAPETATTPDPDSDAPEPSPMTFDSTEASPVSIKLTATTATDASAVEYYFTCTDGAAIGGSDSGWQSSPVYIDKGLVSGSNYTYTVTARDTSANLNSTAPSAPVVVTTTGTDANLVNSLQGFTGDSMQAATYHDLAKAGLEIVSDSIAKVITFDATGASFGPTATWESRNIIRTIAQDYGDSSFEAYATFLIEGTTEQAAFIGVGQGLIGGWGVPDFELVGVNACLSEMQFNFTKAFTFVNGGWDTVTDGPSGVSPSTVNRVKMAYDASAETITFEVDTDYSGGEFASDMVIATHSTTNLWWDMPQRIYIGAGAGVTFKDFEIISADTPVIGVTDLVISSAGQLQWTSVAGQTYDVVYKNDLVAETTWTPDASNQDIPGTGGIISATPGVAGDAVFFNVIAE